jgi:bifunctional DNase/RNase
MIVQGLVKFNKWLTARSRAKMPQGQRDADVSTLAARSNVPRYVREHIFDNGDI